MRVFWIFHEFWSELTPRLKIMISMGLVALMSGVPMSEMGWEWRWMRQIFQVQNCIDDFVNPVMDAIQRGDQAAVERSVGSNKPQHLRSCGSNAIQHPEGTVSFLLDEYRRRPPDAQH